MSFCVINMKKVLKRHACHSGWLADILIEDMHFLQETKVMQIFEIVIAYADCRISITTGSKFT